MSSYIDWNLFLAGYQKRRGGSFFSCGRERLNQCDSQLVLPDGEEPPLLILLQRCAEGRSSWNSLIARTTIPLDGSYSLHIRRKDLTGAGFQTLMSLAGERRDYGDPAALKGRVVTTENRDFTKLVLGDLELRNALIARPGDSLRVSPGPLNDGNHTVEVCCENFDGTLTQRSPWLTDHMAALTDDCFLKDIREETALQKAAQKDFDQQMDGFLAFLRAARDAVKRWPVKK